MSFAKRLLEFAEERGLRDLPHALNIAVKEYQGKPITDEDRRLAELERLQGPRAFSH